MSSLNLSNTVESNGLQFQGFVSQFTLTVMPSLMLEPIQFQIGLQIKNNTSIPVRVALFNTLSCNILSEDNSTTSCYRICGQYRRPSERDFPIISPGETLLRLYPAQLYPAQLSLFVEGYDLKWFTHWWKRFLKLVNLRLAYLSVRWETERVLSLSVDLSDGRLVCDLIGLGFQRIMLTYHNESSSSEFYNRATTNPAPVNNLWIGSAPNIALAVNVLRSS